MKVDSIKRGLFGSGIVCAAIVVGAWSGVLLCDWLDPIPEDEALLAAKAHERVRESQSSSVLAEVARPSKSARGVRGKRWIADVWSGPRRTGAFRVAGVSADGRVEAQCVDAGGARRGFGETIRRALRKRGKAHLEERFARRAENPFDTPEARSRSRGTGGDDDEKDPTIYEGDVYISGLPMIDQGSRAYCAVASAARVLQGYGIEVTMEDMAALAESSECCGTNMRKWDKAMWQVANTHGLRLLTVNEMTEVAQPLSQLIIEYNQAAYTLGSETLNMADYVNGFCENYAAFDQNREYEVQREALLSNEGKEKAFSENVIDRIDDSDPIFWSVLLGDVAEEVPHGNDTYLSADRGAHMRLIIGYNEERGEVLYSDSWGEGHELKRMDACDAMSITTGMYYLAE